MVFDTCRPQTLRRCDEVCHGVQQRRSAEQLARRQFQVAEDARRARELAFEYNEPREIEPPPGDTIFVLFIYFMNVSSV